MSGSLHPMFRPATIAAVTPALPPVSGPIDAVLGLFAERAYTAAPEEKVVPETFADRRADAVPRGPSTAASRSGTGPPPRHALAPHRPPMAKALTFP